MPPHHIGIVAYDGCVASGVSGFADVCAVANHLSGRELFRVHVMSVTGLAVTPFSGPPMGVDGALSPLPPADTATPAPQHTAEHVPDHATKHTAKHAPKPAAGTPTMTGPQPPSIAPGDTSTPPVTHHTWHAIFIPPAFGLIMVPPPIVAWVQAAHAAGSLCCAACAGVFFLAEAGLLDGRPATTHWGLVEQFSRSYPAVNLTPQRLLVDGGSYICAGGVTAYFDLALHLVTRLASRELALHCARVLLLDPGRTEQTPYMELLATHPHGDTLIAHAQQWLETHHTRPLHLHELAAHLHCTERTLHRRFRKATGLAPVAYLQALRVEHAKRLLESTTLPASSIAQEVGYQDTPAFFRVFHSLTELTPGEYRRRFGPRISDKYPES